MENIFSFSALAVATMIVVSCATSPTGRSQLNLVSSSDVDKMGDQAWAETLKQYPVSKDEKATAFVNDVAHRVIAAGPLANQKWDVKLFESAEVNAFALPGGHVGVFSGILPYAQNAAGLATVLAHETGHVIAKHGQERTSDAMLTQGAVAVAGAAVGTKDSTLSGPLMAALGLGAQVGILLPFSRAQESEADHIGLTIMAKAGYDPQEALTFWDRMAKLDSKAPPAFLSDHPATSDRIAALKALMPEAQQDYAHASAHLGAGDRLPAQASP